MLIIFSYTHYLGWLGIKTDVLFRYVSRYTPDQGKPERNIYILDPGNMVVSTDLSLIEKHVKSSIIQSGPLNTEQEYV